MNTMQSIAFALPVLPGKAEALKNLATEIDGPRRGEMEDLLKSTGATIENWYFQATPQGDMVIIYLEGEDIGRAFQAFIALSDPFARWYKEQLLAIHGIDFNQPLPGPIAEPILGVQVRG